MSVGSEAAALVRAHLGMSTSSFSIGSVGAIGEFHRGPSETLDLEDLSRLTLATARGAIRIELAPQVRPVAYEQLSSRERRWQQGVSFCLPEKLGRSSARNTLTELGPDHDAIFERDREAILFDMGLRAENMAFCIRTADPALLAVLRAEEGHDLLVSPGAAMAAIKDRSPHRIARSKLGRIEVFQAIGRTKTPEGPHTHVLPKLIGQGRSHAANIPVPSGTLPCLSLYPANPLSDALGDPKPFSREEHEDFQAVLRRWGAAECLEEKRRVERALAAGDRPEAFEAPRSRLGRTAVRIALRQRTWTHGDDDLTRSWCAAFDRSGSADDDESAD